MVIVYLDPAILTPHNFKVVSSHIACIGCLVSNSHIIVIAKWGWPIFPPDIETILCSVKPGLVEIHKLNTDISYIEVPLEVLLGQSSSVLWNRRPVYLIRRHRPVRNATSRYVWYYAGHLNAIICVKATIDSFRCRYRIDLFVIIVFKCYCSKEMFVISRFILPCGIVISAMSPTFLLSNP